MVTSDGTKYVGNMKDDNESKAWVGVTLETVRTAFASLIVPFSDKERDAKSDDSTYIADGTNYTESTEIADGAQGIDRPDTQTTRIPSMFRKGETGQMEKRTRNTQNAENGRTAQTVGVT